MKRHINAGKRCPLKNISLGKAILFALAIFLAVAVSGCGGDGTGAGAGDGAGAGAGDGTGAGLTEASGSEALYYMEEDIPIPGGLSPFFASFLGREVFLLDGQSIAVMDQEGRLLRETALPEGEYFQAMDIQADRSYWCVSQSFGEGQETPDKINFVNVSRDGAELSRVSADGGQFGKNEVQLYPARLVAGDGHFYLMSYQALYVVDGSGMVIKEARAAGGNLRDPAIFRSLVRLDDGRVAAFSIVYGSETAYLAQLIGAGGEETEEILINSPGMDNIFAAGKEAGILFCTDGGFYDYDLASGGQELVFDNLRHGVSVESLAGVTVLSDGSIALSEKGAAGGISRLSRFVPYVPQVLEGGAGAAGSHSVDYSAKAGKEAVTLAIFVPNSTWLHQAVAGFNRGNEHYNVEIKDYSMNNIIGRDEAITRFNIDLATGDVPDITMLPWYISSDTYISMGALAGLDSFIENDPGFNKGDYLPGLFDSLSLDGKLYELFPLFDLDIITAKKADVGMETGWTLDEFAAFIDARPGAKHILDYYTKRDFIIKMVRGQFVDPLTGETRFDRGEFKKILAVAERFPDTLPQGSLSDFLGGARAGDPLMIADQLDGFQRSKTYEAFYFGEETTIKGWPSPHGNGLKFRTMEFLGITAQAKNPGGAWEFIKYAMDNVKGDLNSKFPVSLASLDEMAKKVQESLNDNRTTITIGDQTLNAGETGFSEADIKKVMDAIKATRMVVRMNRTIDNIIQEEVDSYLGGQKSADTVADIIENRVGIYLAELN
ncbi:MAG: extracellular solute-binding protein [Lachnospiraceae bacterium]|nr:extracellular solute-binding protein [Lachnospiraceae bacterium]